MLKKIPPYLYPLTFLISMASMVGSLYASDVMHLAPCVLCWYQRITMYPIVVLSLIPMVRKDEKAYRYIIPFAIIGAVISAYHTVLYYAVNWGFRPEWTGPCVAGVSCTTRYFELFGWVSIPLMSFLSHIAVLALAVLARKLGKI